MGTLMKQYYLNDDEVVNGLDNVIPKRFNSHEVSYDTLIIGIYLSFCLISDSKDFFLVFMRYLIFKCFKILLLKGISYYCLG